MSGQPGLVFRESPWLLMEGRVVEILGWEWPLVLWNFPGSSPSTGEAHDRKDLPFLLALREKTVLQSTNRKLERRVKELSIQIDDERQHVNDQKDQVRTRHPVDRQLWDKYMLYVLLKARGGHHPPCLPHLEFACVDRD